MIKTYLTLESGNIITGNESQIDTWKKTPGANIWIDIQKQNLDDPEIKELLLEFNCHPLAIQDAVRKRHPPKIEFFDEQIFILYRGISAVIDDLVFEHQQMGFFISERCLITLHPEKSLGIDKVVNGINLTALLSSPLAVAVKVMHASAGIYLEEVLNFETDISNKEDQIQEGLGEKALTELAVYKARLIKIKRVFNYHYNVSQQLKERHLSSLPVKVTQAEHLIIDMDDRFERLKSLAQLHYDICSDIIDSYISITSHKLNITMRVLTVITAIFVPLSFLAGIYGMNFEYIPELKFKYGYFVLMFSMLAIAVGLITTFKRRQWF
ncbi:magnesium transporter CorA family protein [Aestuariicella hydrocarbonica]|uniref:Magnesium transporter CorA family protein n=1 Tax=Pseudomaricurvus hydrocarbonicus TaxID=1470433 RepID=A0A9E5JQW6_9GAMM|nr:magnesium transporter CorA family protein [Aestuariicella hydrocarbonica]NHO64844.1 magnesium transporter CorA family protein [Aestuariicella hydrocarbonica]